MQARLMSSSGFLFDACSLTVEDVDILAIANSLSKQCRFFGNCSEFYSVAQHCVLLSNMVEKKYQKWALLHDAAEAYLSDLAAPIKNIMPQYTELEENALKVIAKKFDLEYPIPEPVLEADLLLRKAEMINLFDSYYDWESVIDFTDARGIVVSPYPSCDEAKFLFINRFKDLFGNNLTPYKTTKKRI